MRYFFLEILYPRHVGHKRSKILPQNKKHKINFPVLKLLASHHKDGTLDFGNSK